jgi:hypothetical protein
VRYLKHYQHGKCCHLGTPRTRGGPSPSVLGVLEPAELVVETSTTARCRNVGGTADTACFNHGSCNNRRLLNGDKLRITISASPYMSLKGCLDLTLACMDSQLQRLPKCLLAALLWVHGHNAEFCIRLPLSLRGGPSRLANKHNAGVEIRGLQH